MNIDNIATWTQIAYRAPDKRPSRKHKKRRARNLRRCRVALVRFAGHHFTVTSDPAKVKAHIQRFVDQWMFSKPIRVPTSLRGLLGKTVGTAWSTWKMTLDMQELIAQATAMANQMKASNPDE